MSIDLAMIGQSLKKAREDRGLSLSWVSRHLCLRREVVEAMEQGDWSALPHGVYVKGYVKRYGDMVGVATGELLVPGEPPLEAPEHPGTSPKSVQSRLSGYVLLGSTVLLVLVMVSFFVPGPSTRMVSGGMADARLSAVRVTGAIPHQGDPAKELTILCHERTWIRVLVDGKERKEFILNPGDAVVMRAGEHFVLLVGNAGGVRLLLNGSDTYFSGESGEVKKVFLS